MANIIACIKKQIANPLRIAMRIIINNMNKTVE